MGESCVLGSSLMVGKGAVMAAEGKEGSQKAVQVLSK